MNKLEDVFKKSLENAEAPYDAKAWDSLASRLDQVMPTTPVKGSFKWAWIAGVVLVAGSTALFFVNQNSTERNNPEIAHNKLENTSNDLKNPETAIEFKDVLVENEAVKVDDKQLRTSAESNQKNSPRVNSNDHTTVSSVLNNNSNNENTSRISQEVVSEKVKPTDLVKPAKEIKAAKEEKITVEAVNSKIDFSVSNETYYEKGLPFNSLTSSVTAKEYKWTNERGEILSMEKNADIHLFTAGSHPITLHVEFANGEKQRVTKTVRCDVNYNLLAATAFNPASSDYRNSTFVPFALLKSERNISFDMQIIDMKTGQVIYETNNADMPWDGMDSRTNQMVPSNTTYVWRVHIHEKALGEVSTRYQGTITKI